jgi:hypothetical protein
MLVEGRALRDEAVVNIAGVAREVAFGRSA